VVARIPHVGCLCVLHVSLQCILLVDEACGNSEMFLLIFTAFFFPVFSPFKKNLDFKACFCFDVFFVLVDLFILVSDPLVCVW
jgi:hypothetical protein